MPVQFCALWRFSEASFMILSAALLFFSACQGQTILKDTAVVEYSTPRFQLETGYHSPDRFVDAGPFTAATINFPIHQYLFFTLRFSRWEGGQGRPIFGFAPGITCLVYYSKSLQVTGGFLPFLETSRIGLSMPAKIYYNINPAISVLAAVGLQRGRGVGENGPGDYSFGVYSLGMDVKIPGP